jgi:hypothetical protein
VPFRSAMPARLLLLGTSTIFAVAAAFFAVRGLGEYTIGGGIVIVGTLAGAAVSLGYVARRLPTTGATRVAREIVMIGVSLLVVEFLIASFAPDNPSRQSERMKTAYRLRIPFDARTKSMVIEQMRDQGEEVLPGMSRDWPRLAPIRQQLPENLFPLGDASTSSATRAAAMCSCGPTSSVSTIRRDCWRAGAWTSPWSASPLRSDIACRRNRTW